jgi:hypothetical protein
MIVTVKIKLCKIVFSFPIESTKSSNLKFSDFQDKGKTPKQTTFGIKKRSEENKAALKG